MRQGAAWVYRILITLFPVAVVVEVFLAGLGIFRAMPGEDESVSHETIEDKFDAHTELGQVLSGGSVLLSVLILVVWSGPRSIAATFALAVLTIVEGEDGAERDDQQRRPAHRACSSFGAFAADPTVIRPTFPVGRRGAR